MGVATAIAVGGAIVGGIAGSMQDHSHSSSSNSSGVDLVGAGANESQATTGIGKDYSALQSMINGGPGQNDVTAAYGQQKDLASMQADYARTGGAASQQDILQAQESAKLQFAPQQVALDQSFKDEQTRASQLAAQLGRPINDPYIQAQLGKERMNNMQMLAANQGAFVGQQSQQNSMNRLGFTQQLTDTRNSLASQAMANRQALLSIGQGIQSNERNWRLQISNKWGNGSLDTTSGGGAKGAMAGGLAGFGMGAGSAKGLMSAMAADPSNSVTTSGDTPVEYGNTPNTYGPPSSMAPMAASSMYGPPSSMAPSYSINPTRSTRLQPTGVNPANMYNYNMSGYDTGVQGRKGWADYVVNNNKYNEAD